MNRRWRGVLGCAALAILCALAVCGVILFFQAVV